MYQNKMVVSIKHNGKILRERGDIVSLPFGSEFSVFVKNLNNRRVKFTLHIDGTDVLDGTSIIVGANSETEIKRFIRNGNMDAGNAFKFIERTAAIENGPRGAKAEDGLIRIEYWYEQVYPYMHDWSHYVKSTPIFEPWCMTNTSTYGNSNHSPTYNDTLMRGISANASTDQMVNCAAPTSASATAQTCGTTASNYVNDTGITVPGSKVDQKFTTVYGFVAESTSDVIVIRMVGEVGSVKVEKPLTVKSKPKCVTCGRLNKSSSSFCSACGTSLDLV